MMNTTTLQLSFLDENREERNDKIEVFDREYNDLVAKGRKIVEDRGEFSAKEMDNISDINYARLAASDAHGGDAYSLACASYL